MSVITAPGTEGFREFVLFIQNGIYLLDQKNELIKTTEQREGGAHSGVDHEDTGEKGYNYRSERFLNRITKHDIHKVFSSKFHGDPATPIFKTYTGERVIFRVIMPGDKPRNVGFTIHGHQWKAQPDDPFSRMISNQGAISVGNVFNMELDKGASQYPGDYLYRSGSLKWDIESGMWGILRVQKVLKKSAYENYSNFEIELDQEIKKEFKLKTIK